MLSIASALFIFSLLFAIIFGVISIMFSFDGELKWSWILSFLLSLIICITAGNYSETITDIYYISAIEIGSITIANGDREVNLVASVKDTDLELRDTVKVTSVVKALTSDSKLISIEKIELLKTGE